MKISEVCKFEVKQHMDHYVKKEGLSRNEASKDLAAWLSDIMDTEIKPGTIRLKEHRIGNDLIEAISMMEEVDEFQIVLLLLELAQFRLQAVMKSETDTVTGTKAVA